MTNLQQKEYEDDNGRPVSAESVECLGSYVHIADGFYHWTCGSCRYEASDRWHNISGRVLACPSCHKQNLLVRTNCLEITESLIRERETKAAAAELERVRGIQKYNADQLTALKYEILGELTATIQATLRKATQ